MSMGSQALIVEQNIAIPMRDGITLYADVYRPDTSDQFPVLLMRTPYNKADPSARYLRLDPLWVASHGYAVVIQDVRGRHSSEGDFVPFFQEIPDGYDTVAWCASQPWSNRKVGMYGRSYGGATQWLAAASGPPALTAIAPVVTPSDCCEGFTHRAGAFQIGFVVSWTLFQLTLSNLARVSANSNVHVLRDQLTSALDNMEEVLHFVPLKQFPYLKDGLAPYFFEWLMHPRPDEFWRSVSIEQQYDRIPVPALNIGGWFDIFLGGTIRNFLGMGQQGATERARSGQKLLIGPWHHVTPFRNASGQAYFGVMAGERL